MKNLLLSTCVWLVTCFSLHAQFQIGLTGGINISTARYQNLEHFEIEPETNIFIGPTMRYHFGPSWSFNSDVLYSRKAHAALFNYRALSYSYEIRVGYLESTPNIQYHLCPGFSIGLGAYSAYRLHTESKDVEEWAEVEEQDLSSRWDFGPMLTLESTFDNVSLFARYYHGLSDQAVLLFTNQNGESVSREMRISNIQFGLSYRFINVGKSNRLD